MSNYHTVAEIKGLLERYCAYQERSPYEVEKKMQSYALIPEAKEHILLHLHQENYLSESRFAEAYVRGKFRQKKWGRLKIKQGLFQHRISEFNAKKAFAQIPETEYREQAEVLAKKKLKQISDTNSFAKKKKLVQYLCQKGYENHLAFELSDKLIS